MSDKTRIELTLTGRPQGSSSGPGAMEGLLEKFAETYEVSGYIDQLDHKDLHRLLESQKFIRLDDAEGRLRQFINLQHVERVRILDEGAA
ncbi:hypothetical protein [Nesterenkonia flava]|uniref:Uncharacterized protein n=1 Tax=Nesterenkonia flava TaxID=469799 RepID=A0ABU1FV47_9MICC|nr:hypothetical protein [Nesterenkonia flava]MDR5712531.1 hypothetical protein [Nesterenkonia flava]